VFTSDLSSFPDRLIQIFLLRVLFPSGKKAV
jgi:hypothetical protein